MTADRGGPELDTPTRRTAAPAPAPDSNTGNGSADVESDDVRELLAGLSRRQRAAQRLPALPHRAATGSAARDPWLPQGAA